MLLQLTGVTVRLGSATALDHVDLTVAAGEFVGLVGPNGTGKTTLLRVAAGLVPAASGSVQVSGRSVATLGPAGVARALAYLPYAAPCHWPMPVRDVVALGRLPHRGAFGRETPADTAAIDRAVALADVAAFASRSVDTLSDGERTRVLIARALAQAAPLLLADEPTASLDPYHQLRVMEVMTRLAREGLGVLAVFHDLSLAARFCHRIALLVAGRVVASGAAADVLTHERVLAAYGVHMSVDGSLALPPAG